MKVSEVDENEGFVSENKDGNAEAISEYEKNRLDNIRRNEDFLKTLGIDNAQESLHELAKAKRASVRGASKPKRPLEVLPLRRSGRVTSERLRLELDELRESNRGTNDPTVIETIEKKEKEYNEMMEKKNDNTYATVYIEQQEERRSRKLSPILLSIENFNENGESNVEKHAPDALNDILKVLTKSSQPRATSAKADQQYLFKDSETKQYKEQIQNLKLAETDVAKVTNSRITSIFVHPSVEKDVVFAGDKEGIFGIWDVNNTTDGDGGVYKFPLFVSNICQINVRSNDPGKVYACSYDGTVRFVDIDRVSSDAKTFATSSSAAVSVLAFCIPESIDEVFVSDAAFMSQSESVLLGFNDGHCGMADFRASQSSYQWRVPLQLSKLNSIQQHPLNQNLVIASGAGQQGCISVHDLRKMSGKGATKGISHSRITSVDKHSKSINAAYVSPNGEYIVSVSQDNTVKCWSDFTSSSSKWSCSTIRHDNHTGRWLSTFRPTFDVKRPATFVLGSMARPRMIEIFDIKRGELDCMRTIKGEFLNSVCSRNAFHPARQFVACGNSSGRVHVLK